MAKTKSAAGSDRDEQPSRNGQPGRSGKADGGQSSDEQASKEQPEPSGGNAPAKESNGKLDGLGRERLQEMLYQMLLGRRFEEKTAEAYAIGKIGGFCHLYIGQEAVTVGAFEPLRPDDYVISAYREHVQALVKGIPPRNVMAELYGRADGCSGGKGGSMHLYSAEHNFMGGWGIVGGQVPLATGYGWAIKYRGEDRVALCFMGEAAVNQGAFHESLNMAALWKLPVIFIVENNRFGMGTAWERASSLYDISQKASAYDMPAAVADGMDVLNMRKVVKEAVDRARTEKTPTLIEARCYRFMGHSMSDPVHGVYRTKEEVEEHKELDPIRRFIDQLKEASLLTEDELQAIDKRVHEEVDDAGEFADNSPEPTEEALYSNVYASEDVAGRLYFDGRRQS
ncbi:MAG TPA: pyruvate dehydrogenase (acetyl-transferring) E1 component subunit alpha [Longimicrobiales bacterium]|nr:pyruvate dehydrogenase (acetyl-transferring) E1 component subunit alpha [Longimicrobiales bacterium]